MKRSSDLHESADAAAQDPEVQAPPPTGPRPVSLTEEVELSLIDANPLNPRSRLTPDPELVASMKDLGLLQPIVVRPRGDRFDLLAGQRRLLAAGVLEWPTIPALIFRGEIADSGLVLLAENSVRKDFDALEEAALVGALREKSSQEHVASALGRSVKWVARRERLNGLSPIARRAAQPGGVLHAWPPSWLEEIALLAPAAQDELLAHELEIEDAKDAVLDPKGRMRNYQIAEITSIEQLQELVRERLHALRLARWALDDAKLVAAVGSCLKCPKTSAAVPGLFGDVAAPQSPLEATCLDSVCWAGKAAAFLVAKLADAKREHGPGVLLVHGKDARDGAHDVAPDLDGRKVLSDYEYKPAKNGKPALVVSGPKAGTVIRIARAAAGGDSGVAPAKTAAEKSLKEKRAELANRRARRVLAMLAEHVKESEWDELSTKSLGRGAEDAKSDAGMMLKVIGRLQESDALRNLPQPLDLRADKKTGWLKLADILEGWWLELREQVERALLYRADNAAEDGIASVREFGWLAEWTGFKVEDAARAAAVQLPEPASWSNR